MKKNLELSCATSAIALAILSVAPALAAPGDAIVEIETEIDQDASAWTVDRADVATFANETWQGRDGAIHIEIAPPANPGSFYNWQGYNQTLDTPAGPSSIKGDLWIGSEWAEGTDTDYVRTGIWGSVQPEGTTGYVDDLAIFPIISFTNEDGEARLQVWDTTANPSGGWVNLAASESALSLDEWNTFEMRVLPGSDRIDYVVNDVVIYSWDMPRGGEDNVSDEFYAVYLNGRNNGVTSFDTYWSQLAQAQLVLDGESVTAAPEGLNVLANAQGSVDIAAGVTVGGTVHSGSGSDVTLSFGEDAGVATTGEAGVVSDEGGVLTLDGGSVVTTGTNAPAIVAVNTGSEIHTIGTYVSAAGSAAVVAANGGLVTMEGGSVATSGASSPALLAVGAGSALTTNGTQVTADGSAGALAMDGATITLESGSVASAQNALVANGATIGATDVAISGHVGALATSGGAITLAGGTVSSTNHGTMADGGSVGLTDVALSTTVSGANTSEVGGVSAKDGGTASVSRSTITLEGGRMAGLFAISGGEIVADDVAISGTGDRVRGAYAHADDDGAGSITIAGGMIETDGFLSHGLFGKRESGTIADTVATIAASDLLISVDGDNANGVYADVGSNITINNSMVTTSGQGGIGLHAQGSDDGLVGEGVLIANSVDVITAGDGAHGGYAELGGELVVQGGSIATAGAEAHGLVAYGTSDYAPQITATGVELTTTGEGSFGIGIAGTGSIAFANGTIDAADAAIGVDAAPDGLADFTVSGSTLASATGTVLDVSRDNGDGTAIVTLALGTGTTATGDLIDTGDKTTGYTDVTLDGATLTGAVDGLRTLTLDGGAIWNATGVGTLDEIALGSDGASIGVAQGNTVLTYAALTGDGALTKIGTGTLALSGDGSAYDGTATIDAGKILLTNIFAGDVVIKQDGTLELGVNVDTVQMGDLTGSTQNDGTLVFALPGDYDYTGALSGEGDLIKKGDGVLTLSGEYTYVGSTIVEGGTVRLTAQLDEETDLVVDGGTFDLDGRTQTVAGVSGEGGTIDFGAGGSLTADQWYNSVYAGTMSGSGDFVKAGEGRLVLTGSSDGPVQILINGGLVSVNGDYADSPFIVGTGGALGGSGIVGSTTVEGKVGPGNSIGTLHVVGDIDFEVGSVYEVEVDASGNSDLIEATGAANINGGTVSVLAAAGNYALSSDYLILTADGGVNGTFDGTDVDLPFLDSYLSYGANDVMLQLVRNDDPFVSAALTANQASVAAGLETADAPGLLYRTIAGQTSAANARAAFDALSGEVWGTASTVLIDSVQQNNDRVLGRLRQADDITVALGGFDSQAQDYGSRTAVWGQAFGSWGRDNGDGNVATAVDHEFGFVTGLDVGLGAWRVGAAFTYATGEVRVDGRDSSVDTDTKAVSAYVGGGLGDLRVHLGATYSWHDLDGRRGVDIDGLSEDNLARFDGNTGSVFGELSYVLQSGGMKLAPFVAGSYVHMKTDGFTESGEVSGLAVESGKRDVGFARVGLRAAGDWQVGEGAVISPTVSAAWRRTFGDREGLTAQSFSTSDMFVVEGASLPKDVLEVQAGFDSEIVPGGSIGASYVGSFASGWRDHGLKIGFSYGF